jgi:hypothetical protein
VIALSEYRAQLSDYLRSRMQVRFCRYRFSPTGELEYSGIRGAEG